MDVSAALIFYWNFFYIFLKLVFNSILHGEIHNFSCWSHDMGPNLSHSQGSPHPAHSPTSYFSSMGLNSHADAHPDFFSSCLAKCTITKLRLETSFPLSLPPLGLQNHKTYSVLCNTSDSHPDFRQEFRDKKLPSLSFLVVVLSQTSNCLTTARTATAVARVK